MPNLYMREFFSFPLIIYTINRSGDLKSLEAWRASLENFSQGELGSNLCLERYESTKAGENYTPFA